MKEDLDKGDKSCQTEDGEDVAVLMMQLPVCCPVFMVQMRAMGK